MELPTGASATLRPLEPGDREALARFYEGLAEETRRFYDVHGDTAALAAERCEAIGRYDKVRLVLEMEDGEIGGLFELSLDLVKDELRRYRDHGIPLKQGRHVRYGLCLADSLQGRGIASKLQPLVEDVARLFGVRRIILLGGVHEDNERAVASYRRVGFREAGRFVNPDGVPCLDMILELDGGVPGGDR